MDATLYRKLRAQMLQRVVSPLAVKYLCPAFDGDAEAAFSLSVALDNHERGAMAVVMWEINVPLDAFRSYFVSVWDHDHRWVIEAAQTRRRLASMFRYADFQLPESLPDMVRVWRGTSKLSFAKAARGYSWTTDRDIACWFAVRFADFNGSPLVLVADVPKSEIAMFHEERSESEAVLMKAPKSARYDGDAQDWQAGFLRHQTAKNEQQTADLNRFRPS